MTALTAVGAGVRVIRGRWILADVDWAVDRADRWAVIGANGSGKTTLLRLAGAELRPTTGVVDVLGQRLGRTDMRELRRRIGVASSAVALRPTITAHEAVVSARHGVLEVWWHEYVPADHQRADMLLATMGCEGAGDRQIATLSQGERQRVMLARALMPDPGLLLLDEPAAGLDLPAREALLTRLTTLTVDGTSPPMIMVTHHLEEIPVGMTHALLLRDGRVVDAGPIAETITGDALSATFGITVKVERRDGRWAAWGA